jgi:hypothetical protein
MEQVYCSPRLMSYPKRSMLAVYPGATGWLPASRFFRVQASPPTRQRIVGGAYALES